MFPPALPKHICSPRLRHQSAAPCGVSCHDRESKAPERERDDESSRSIFRRFTSRRNSVSSSFSPVVMPLSRRPFVAGASHHPLPLHHGYFGSPSRTVSRRHGQFRLLGFCRPPAQSPATFAAPFCTRPDPGEDDVLLGHRNLHSFHGTVSLKKMFDCYRRQRGFWPTALDCHTPCARWWSCRPARPPTSAASTCPPSLRG